LRSHAPGSPARITPPRSHAATLTLDLEVFRLLRDDCSITATIVVLPQSYASFRELPVHDADSLEHPFHRASTVSETLSLASRPPMRFCALQRLRLAAAATARLASPDLPAPAGFLTLMTPCLRREPSGLVSYR
jgi:hypothetical protein